MEADQGRYVEVAKGRTPSSHQRAMQQRIEAGYRVATSSDVIRQQSKAEIRAEIPPYDESMVRKIPMKPQRKSR